MDENGRRKYQQDADDFKTAVDSNINALSGGLKKDGWSDEKIEQTREKLKEGL